MDEILIDEKRYVSSKRAAKITGYAKDYIGQLCREGRVPARLVGRSWYVLESAIQDHRFGTKEVKPLRQAESPVIEKTWESPRYEAASGESLPVVNRLRVTDSEDSSTPTAVAENEPEDSAPYLQDSWREWFDHVRESKPEDASSVLEISQEEHGKETEEEEPVNSKVEEEAQSIPIHTVYDLPPRDLLPVHHPVKRVEEEPLTTNKKKERASGGSGWAVLRTFQVFSLLLATLFAAAGLIGSGFYDHYITSIEQAKIISGIVIYNK